MIKLEHIYKSYKNIELFKDMNLEIEQGEKVAISGPNGSGKSVLLKMISGYAKPDSGRVIVDGKCINETFSFIQNAGISINAPDFIGSMSGLENLLYLASIKKIATKDRIISLANNLGLDNLDKKYKTYSLGMKQKMRLIQAIMDNPKYLILDEPFDALDDKSKKAAIDILHNLENGTSIIFVTHDKDTIFSLATVHYKINNYKLELVGND